MISVSDALKILDQIPVWKQIRELPKRVTELEHRLAALEGKPKAPIGRECPICGSEMRVVAEHPHSTFGFAGLKVHDMQCECGHSTQRNFAPGKGYE